MEQQELEDWQLIGNEADAAAVQAATERLMDRYHGLAQSLATRQYQRLTMAGLKELAFEDLFSSALIGLWQAIQRFDMQRGFKPSTFLSRRITGAILDDLRDQMPFSRTRLSLSKARDAEEERLCHELGRMPTEDELPSIGLRMTFSLDAETHTSRRRPDGSQTYADVTPDHRSQSRIDLGELAHLMRSWTTKERLMVSLYHIYGYTMRETAELLGLSESRVSQCLHAIKERLRAHFEAETDPGRTVWRGTEADSPNPVEEDSAAAA